MLASNLKSAQQEVTQVKMAVASLTQMLAGVQTVPQLTQDLESHACHLSEVQQAVTALQVAAAHCTTSGHSSGAVGTSAISAEEYAALLEEICLLRSQVTSLSTSCNTLDGCCPDIEGTGSILCAAALAEVRELASKGVEQGDWLCTRLSNLSTQVEQMDLEAAKLSDTISAIVSDPLAHLSGLVEI